MSTTDVTLSLGISTFGPAGSDWRGLTDLARMAEDAGIDRLVISDHVVLGPNVSGYPWGTFPTGPDADWLEPLTVIAAMAAVTTTVRFVTGVLIAPLRPAALLAKTVATLDVVSNGRVDLGVGTGWQPEEFTALGLRFADRGRLLTETIEQCHALWTGGPVDVTGVDGETTQVWCAPTPIQAPLPVWFSGTLNARNLDRIVRLGDGWIPIMGTTPEQFADSVATLHEALAAAGRPADSVAVRGTPAVARDADKRADLDATLAAAPALVAAGATDIQLPYRAFDPRGSEPAATFSRVADRFRTALA